jgi:hypothetical protein
MKVKQALLILTEKFIKDVEADKKDGLSHDVVETWKGEALAVMKDALEFLNDFGEGDLPRGQTTAWGLLGKSLEGWLHSQRP